MNEVMISSIVLTSFGYSILRLSTAIIFAALASLVSKKAGVNNIALEGIMLFSALAGVLVSAYTKNAWFGLLGAIVVGVLISLLLGLCAIHLRANIFLSGIAINTIGSFGTVFIMFLAIGDKASTSTLQSFTLPRVALPLIKDIPVVSEILSNHNVLTYLAFVAAVLLYIFLYITKTGLHLRSVGENPVAAGTVGINVVKMQYLGLAICGILCGMGGAFMSMGYTSWFSRDMIAGRGFIAIAASSMGQNKILGTVLSCLLFGIADAVSNIMQTFDFPSDLILAMPYVTTIVCITVYSVFLKNKKAYRVAEKSAKRRNVLKKPTSRNV